MSKTEPVARIVVLGASGLIGQTVGEALAQEGFAVTAVARRFTAAQTAAFGRQAVTCPMADLDPDALARLLSEHRPDVVLNCLGVLQDGPRGTTQDVHAAFVARLLRAIGAQSRPVLLMHVSIPGQAKDDATPFSRTKREAETLIARSSCPFVILRPGFVIAPGAYGGSALIRSLAALPLALPQALADRPFGTTAVDDIVRTVSSIARRWNAGERRWNAVWDIVEDRPATVGTVLEAFRRRFGGAKPVRRLPVWLLRAGARAGDAAALLGWSPPVRTTALREMMRGVEGDPRLWIAESAFQPMQLSQTLERLPLTIQERWFGRLILLKPLILACLAIFWIASGFIALLAAFEAATAILTARGLSDGLARAITIVSSLADITVGLAIAWRRTCRLGLLGGIAVSLFYMASATFIAPDLWTEPLGALVKTGPAILLMAVALAMLVER